MKRVIGILVGAALLTACPAKDGEDAGQHADAALAGGQETDGARMGAAGDEADAALAGGAAEAGDDGAEAVDDARAGGLADAAGGAKAEASGDAKIAGAEDDGAPDPAGFTGFSADGRRFAYSVWSDGAGFHVFTVVDAETGRRVTDLPLDTADDLSRARSLLTEGGYVGTPRSAEAVLSGDRRLDLSVENGRVQVALVDGDRRVTLRPGTGFEESSKHFAAPKAELWGFSPDGRRAAIRVSQYAGPELGTGVTYHVVTLPERAAP